MAYAEITPPERAAGQLASESLLRRLRDNPISVAEQDLSSPWRRFTRAPPFLRWFGSGIMGAQNLSTQTIVGGVYDTTDFTLAVGQILTVTSGILCIHATGTIDITGTIDLSGAVRSNDPANNIAEKVVGIEVLHNYALGGSGGGSGAVDGTITSVANGPNYRCGGWAAGLEGGKVSTGWPAVGSDGNNRPLSNVNGDGEDLIVSLIGTTWVGGSSGGEGIGSSSPGAFGGGMIVLIAPTINLNPGSSFNLSGVTPSDATGGGVNDKAGSGGGAGGLMFIAAQSLSDSSTANIAGAAGSPGIVQAFDPVSAGGAGGNGAVVTFTIPS